MLRHSTGAVLLAICVLAVAGCRKAGGKEEPAGEIREPAVAGLFYPQGADELSAQVDRLLAEAETVPLGKLRGVVCPHAGYEFSGPVAASAYKQLAGRDIDTVVVLAPSHYADFSGASVADVAGYATPLGTVGLSPKAAELAGAAPFCRCPACEVSRPPWWRQAPKEVPPFGEDTPHTWEHSLEVQLPFLQRVLDGFQLVPAVFGRADAERAAGALETILDDQTLIVASSDLSHYHPYDVAAQLDASCVRAICDLDVKWMEGEEACGKLPVLVLMHLARRKGWKTRLLDARNSGDISGDRSRVVGYAAVAFYEGEAPGDAEQGEAAAPSPEDKAFLLELARRTLTEAVESKTVAPVDPAEVPERLRRRGACFVTLTKAGQLRGCIGHIYACAPLYRSVMENAVRAALADHRFPPVEPEELSAIEIEISILTSPRRVDFDSPADLLGKLLPGVDGVVLGLREHRATYLPQVWEQIPEKEAFLSQLAEKAGLEPSAWKDPDAAVLAYQAEAFHEAEK